MSALQAPFAYVAMLICSASTVPKAGRACGFVVMVVSGVRRALVAFMVVAVLEFNRG